MKFLFLPLLTFAFFSSFGQVTNIKAGSWNDPASWINNLVPDGTSDVILSYDINVETNAVCRSLNTNGHDVIVQEGVSLDVVGSENVNSIATDSFPNKVGDKWIYNVRDVTVDRSGSDSPFVQFILPVSVVDSIELPEGIKAKVWVYYYPKFNDTNYVYQSGDTIHFIDVNSSMYSIYGKQYVLPISLGRSWEYTDPGFQDVTVDSQANILAGINHFDSALHIYGNGGMPDAIFLISEWFKNYIGVIKRHFDPFGELIDPRHLTDWSLISFQLK